MEDEYSEHTLTDKIGVAFGILALIILMTGNAYAVNGECWNGTAGATSSWTLNETVGVIAWDNCGAFNGTKTANVDINQPGFWSTSYYFEDEKADEYVASSTPFTYDEDFTVSTWYKPNTNIGANSDRIWKDNGGFIACTREGGDTTLVCSLHDGVKRSVSGNYLTVDAWNHIVFACEMTQYCHLWVNDTYKGNVSVGTTGAAVGTWFITGESGGNLRSPNGYVDAVQVFNYSIANFTDDTAVSNLFTYNNVSGAAGAPCTVDFSPLTAELSVATAITGTKSGACGAWDGDYYWNFTNYTGYEQTATVNPTTQTFNNYGQWIGNFTATIGGVNYTSIQNITVIDKPIANFTIETTPPFFVYDTIQFNDTSYDTNTPLLDIDGWYWDFDDGNTSVTQNATNTFVLPGEYEVCLIAQNNETVNSTSVCETITVNGFSIDVYDESTLAEIGLWNATITNSTGCSYSATNQNNTWVWSNFTDVCTGSVTINVGASGYVARTYYGVFNIGSYIQLTAYLLDSASGVYPVFIVRDTSASPIEDAVISFLKSIGGSYTTVGQATTDASGTAQVYLDPATTYRLTVTAGGYNTYSTDSFTPVSTTYIITLTQNSSITYDNYSSILYAYIYPGDTRVGNTSVIEFRCNDPWSNVAEYGMWIVNYLGATVYSTSSAASASCGIISTNLSAYAVDLPNFEMFTVYGFVFRNGINYTYSHQYGMGGSWGAGLGNILGEFSDVNPNSPWEFNHTGTAIMSQNDLGILAFIVIAAVTFGASMSFGWGAGVVGVIVAGFFTYFGWLDITLFLFSLVAMIAVYASRRWL